MSDPSEAHHNQAWTAYQDCDHATEFMVCDDCVAKAIAAAEERGRRRGVEDLQTMLQNAAPHIIGAGHFRLWNCKCGYCAPLQDALASRDSIHEAGSGPKVGVLTDDNATRITAPLDSAPVAAPKVPTPDIDAAWSAQAGVCGLLPATVICSECGPISGAISPAELERLAPRDSGKVAMVKEFTREEAVAMFGPRKDRP